MTVRVDGVDAAAYTIPTDRPESDGTLEWDSTTVMVVHVHGGGRTGLGYTYAHESAATLVRSTLAGVVAGLDAFDVGAAWKAMVAAVRNIGRPGIASMAISAVDIALWDLRARLHDISVADFLHPYRDAIPVYGSGGFCGYSHDELATQLRGWVRDGIPAVKMKVGRDPANDEARVRVAREAIGDGVDLLTDANGAYRRKQALDWAHRLADHGVVWLEEPVSSDDLEGLRLVRDRGPGGVEVAAGEYGFDASYFHHMLDAGAVDCLQADVTRCGGITGFLQVGGLCDARAMGLSAHTAPHVSAYACLGIWHLRHLEYFHDHARIEPMLFDGALRPDTGGRLRPDRDRPGLGIELKEADAQEWAA